MDQNGHNGHNGQVGQGIGSDNAMKSNYRVDELAKEWHISDRTVRRYIEDGKLNGFRIGPRLVRVRSEEKERFEKENLSQEYIRRHNGQ